MALVRVARSHEERHVIIRHVLIRRNDLGKAPEACHVKEVGVSALIRGTCNEFDGVAGAGDVQGVLLEDGVLDGRLQLGDEELQAMSSEAILGCGEDLWNHL